MKTRTELVQAIGLDRIAKAAGVNMDRSTFPIL